MAEHVPIHADALLWPAADGVSHLRQSTIARHWQTAREAAHRDAIPATRVLPAEIEFDDLVTFEHLGGSDPGAVVDEPVTDQAEIFGSRIEQDHVVKLVDDGDACRRAVDDAVQHLRHGQFALVRPVGPGVREPHQSGAEDGPGDRAGNGEQDGLQHTHVSNRT